MKILIAYATTEGQTRKIARFCADTLTDSGHSVELLCVDAAEGLDPSRFDAAILACSVHIHAYQPDMIAFATAHAGALAGMKTLFLPVSMAAAGKVPEEMADLDAIAAQFSQDTGFAPDRVEQIAGALKFKQYDFLRYWAMRWIAHQHGETPDPKADTEYTDWDALRAILSDWVGA